MPQLKRILFKCPYGRLGNRLYRFGNSIAFAHEHQLALYDYAFSDTGFSDNFEGPAQNEVCTFPVDAPPPKPYTEGYGDLTPNEKAFSNNGDAVYNMSIHEFRALGIESLYLHGFHFQANELVKKHRQVIVDFFRPSEAIRQRADSGFPILRQKVDCIVGVHIRHTDFKEWEGGRYYFTPEVYCEYMRQTQLLLPGKQVLFLIFTDGELDPSMFPGLLVLFSKGSACEDLYSMSKCDFLLGPTHSTFSGWASFFGNVPIHTINSNTPNLSPESFKANEYLCNAF